MLKVGRAGTVMMGAATLVLAGCAGDSRPMVDTGAIPLTTDATAAAHTDLDAATAILTPIDDSGVTGSVRLVPAATGTEVTVALRGAREGVHQGHIHGGTCTNRTRAIVPLAPVTVAPGGAGEATATIELPMETLQNGNHIVVYHEVGGSPGASITCAEIPAQGTAPTQDTARPPR